MTDSFPSRAARRATLRRLAATAAGALGLAALPAAHAQEFPQKGPVRIVVPFPPGGAVDALARMVATQLAQKWKQSVVVDNKPGGNQIIGSQLVASAPPDGYTLLLATTGHAVNATLIEKLPYDPLKDFTPLTLSATAPNILVTHPSAPGTLQQFIAHLRANPRKLNAGHPGVGTTLHLGLEILKAATQTDFGIVGYKGTAPALNALLAGEVDFMFDVTAAIPHVKADKLRALAVTSPTRSTLLPDVPTLAEAGLPGVEIFSWYAFLAPAGTPKAVVDRLNQDINDVVHEPEVRQRMSAYGLEPARRMTAADVRTFVQRETNRWGKVVTDAKVKAE